MGSSREATASRRRPELLRRRGLGAGRGPSPSRRCGRPLPQHRDRRDADRRGGGAPGAGLSRRHRRTDGSEPLGGDRSGPRSDGRGRRPGEPAGRRRVGEPVARGAPGGRSDAGCAPGQAGARRGATVGAPPVLGIGDRKRFGRRRGDPDSRAGSPWDFVRAPGRGRRSRYAGDPRRRARPVRDPAGSESLPPG